MPTDRAPPSRTARKRACECRTATTALRCAARDTERETHGVLSALVGTRRRGNSAAHTVGARLFVRDIRAAARAARNACAARNAV